MASNRKLKVDMTGVESYNRCPEGTWRARVKRAEMTQIQGSGDDGIKAQLEVISGKAKGCSVFETFSLSEKALWKLKSFLEAIGMKANGKMMLDLDKIEGKICEIDVIHDEYNGAKRAKVAGYNKPEDDIDDEDIDDEELDEEDEEEEAPKTKKSTKKAPAKAKKRPDPEEEDEEEDEDDEEEEKPTPKKSKKAPAKPAKKPKKQPEPEEEDDDDDWEDDDE